MKFGTTANPQQVRVMSHVVDSYCKHLGIQRGTPEEEHVASVILSLHEIGVRGENDLLRALIVPNGKLNADEVRPQA